MYDKAEEHLRRAVRRLTAEYTRAVDTEALYHLALVLRAQGKLDEAYDLFHRASWDYAFRAPSYYQLAEMSCGRGISARRLEQIDQSLATNSADSKALNLKAAILTRLDRPKEAEAVLAKVLAEDPLDFLAMNELSLAQGKSQSTSRRDKGRADAARPGDRHAPQSPGVPGTRRRLHGLGLPAGGDRRS